MIFLHFEGTNNIIDDCTPQLKSNFKYDLSGQKRFCTRGTLRSIMNPRLAKITTLFHDWPRSLQ